MSTPGDTGPSTQTVRTSTLRSRVRYTLDAASWFDADEIESSRRMVRWYRARLTARSVTVLAVLTAAGLGWPHAVSVVSPAVAAAVLAATVVLADELAVTTARRVAHMPNETVQRPAARLFDLCLACGVGTGLAWALLLLVSVPAPVALAMLAVPAVFVAALRAVGGRASLPASLFADLDDDDLRFSVQRLAEGHGLAVERIAVRRATAGFARAGATVYPSPGRGVTVAVDEELLKSGQRVLTAVVAHELAHVLLDHGRRLRALEAARHVGAFAFVLALHRGLSAVGAVENASAALPLYLAAWLAWSTAAGLGESAYERYAERAADKFSVAATDRGSVMAALRGLTSDGLAIIEADRLVYRQLSHPPLLERMAVALDAPS